MVFTHSPPCAVGDHPHLPLSPAADSAKRAKDISYSDAMKPVQELSGFVKQSAEIVVEAINRQVKQMVRLVTKPPKKPPLSWESIIGERPPGKANAHAVVRTVVVPELPQANQLLMQLATDIFDELFRRIQKNIIDEIQAIRLYEKLFDCEVQILRGHVHFYKCTSDKDEETIDYTTLISRLRQMFEEHREMVARRTAA